MGNKTKIVVLVQSEQPTKKRIEFTGVLTKDGIKKGIQLSQQPKEWVNIILLRKDWDKSGLDLMAAYNENDNFYFCLFVGKFNDGIV